MYTLKHSAEFMRYNTNSYKGNSFDKAIFHEGLRQKETKNTNCQAHTHIYKLTII